jgi:glycosyltransferase involved in cell wall biosynthesis
MQLKAEPFVSIVTPVYNAEPYIAECIQSVLSQTHTNWEYIIANNCSSDRTLDIAKSFAAKDPRIRIHNNTQFVDVITNHNLALRLISPHSKYCKIICADDWLFPECITQMVNLAEANPTVGIVAVYTISGETIGNVGLPYPSTVVSGKDVCRRTLLGGAYVLGAPSSLLYRSGLVRGADAFFPSLSPHADLAACYEYLQHCDFGFVHQVLAFERIHSGQTSETSRKHNYYIGEHLHNLVTYGPKYLAKEELSEQLKEHLAVYYRFLGKSLFRRKDKEFWEYHGRQLKECGHPLNRVRLTKSLCLQILKAMLNPWRTWEGLSARS